MGKRRDYTDYIQYILNNQHLSRTDAWKQYKADGGHIQKKQALDLYQETFSVQKGEDKGWSTRQIIEQKQVINWPKKPEEFPKEERHRRHPAHNEYEDWQPDTLPDQRPKVIRNNYFKIDNFQEYDSSSGLSKRILESVQELYNTDERHFTAIYVKIDAESSMNPYWNFRFFLPDGKDTRGVKSLFNQLCSQALTYYNNLKNKYSEKEEEINEAMESFREAAREIKHTKGLTYDKACSIMEDSGIHIERIEKVVFN
jgi:hypothetical protein